MPKIINETRIIGVELDGDDGLIVRFSDMTIGAFVVEEMLELRPVREKVEEPRSQPPAKQDPL